MKADPRHDITATTHQTIFKSALMFQQSWRGSLRMVNRALEVRAVRVSHVENRLCHIQNVCHISRICWVDRRINQHQDEP